jgi:hypothetical protein
MKKNLALMTYRKTVHFELIRYPMEILLEISSQCIKNSKSPKRIMIGSSITD